MKKKDAFLETLERIVKPLAYWIGWHHSSYPHHPIVEGAFVAELIRALAAHLPTGESLVPEHPLEMLPRGSGIMKQRRPEAVDIAVGGLGKTRHRNRRYLETCSALIEVKRWQGSQDTGRVEADIEHLAGILAHSSKETRAFMVVFGAGSPISAWTITIKGAGTQRYILVTKKRKKATAGGIRFKRRRVSKALPSTKSRRCHTVCIFEVEKAARP